MKMKLKMQKRQKPTERQPSQRIRTDRLNDDEVNRDLQTVVKGESLKKREQRSIWQERMLRRLGRD